MIQELEWTRERYLALFDGSGEAMDFEEQCLQVGREFLPQSARDVLDGQDPAPAYWQWLASQLEDEDEDEVIIITVSNPRPSRYYPADEIARHNWRDFDVTIGSVRGEITLPDRFDFGTPIDGWCSDAIVKFLESLDSGDLRRLICNEMWAQAGAL